MKLHILSDLHIEFGDMKTPAVNADIVIMAGDIHIGKKGLNWIKNKFKNKEIIYVLGNHEYYYDRLPELCSDLISKTGGTRIHILENSELIKDDVVFLGCTLWTDFDLYYDIEGAAEYAQTRMNDYRLIKTGPKYTFLTPSDTINIFNQSFIWLKRKVKEYKNKRVVVVTHNAPSGQSCHPKYTNDILNAAFASNLEKFIEDSNISLWIHGHIHDSADYMIGDTRIICNPRGYCGHFGAYENHEFKNDLVVEVD